MGGVGQKNTMNAGPCGGIPPHTPHKSYGGGPLGAKPLDFTSLNMAKFTLGDGALTGGGSLLNSRTMTHTHPLGGFVAQEVVGFI